MVVEVTFEKVYQVLELFFQPQLIAIMHREWQYKPCTFGPRNDQSVYYLRDLQLVVGFILRFLCALLEHGHVNEVGRGDVDDAASGDAVDVGNY